MLFFTEVGIDSTQGLLIDNVVVEIAQITSNQLEENPDKNKANFGNVLLTTVSALYLFPLSQSKGLRYIGLFVEDLSIYSYDNRFYNATMDNIFVTLNKIEEAKWTLLNAASKVPINNSVIPMSDLTAFSNEKHV